MMDIGGIRFTFAEQHMPTNFQGVFRRGKSAIDKETDAHKPANFQEY